MGRLAPKAYIMLDKERPLSFSFKAVGEFEKISGLKMVEGKFNIASTSIIPQILWCALKDADADMPFSVDEVAEYLDFAKTPEYVVLLCKLQNNPVPPEVAKMLMDRGVDPNSLWLPTPG